VIVVVEGPSAAGKTTWCRAHGAAMLVAEYAPRAGEPDGSDPAASLSYWTGVNSDRWRQAEVIEQRHGLAVCDSDPLKLHYSWCLARIGAAPADRFRQEAAAVRELFVRRRLGMADLVLVTDPPADELRRRRAGDSSRRRRNFELHARLAEPLREWYSAMTQLDQADRVRWDLPAAGLPSTLPPRRPDRSDPALLDQLLDTLPAGASISG
jgi:hypothetical protein